MNKRTKSNSIRIIAGSWRGRRVSVLDSEGLRPTTSRVRETLFNWLMHDVAGATCLDLFSGSGVLGFECLSRGAGFVDFVESDSAAAQNIQSNISLFLTGDEQSKVNVNRQDALRFLKEKKDKRYDIVFVDPPFQSSLAVQSLSLLSELGCLNDNALVYIEQDSNHDRLQAPKGWQLHREGQAGQSAYQLYVVPGDEQS